MLLLGYSCATLVLLCYYSGVILILFVVLWVGVACFLGLLCCLLFCLFALDSLGVSLLFITCLVAICYSFAVWLLVFLLVGCLLVLIRC